MSSTVVETRRGPRMRPPPQGEGGALPRRARLYDVLFLTAVSVLPGLFYVSSVGFYLDDFYLLGSMSTSDDQSIAGLYHALTSDDPKSQLRPVEYLLLACLYSLFGSDPLPYHVFLAVQVPLCAVFLYLLLGQLRQPRFLALGVPVLFATAPHYSSDRFWLVAHPPVLSLTLCLVSVFSGLRALESKGRRLAAWLVLSASAMLISLFMYEIPLPLFVLAAGFFWYRARGPTPHRRIVAASYSSLLALCVAAKVLAAVKIGGETSYGLGYETGFLHHMAYLVSGAIKVNFGTYGVGLPYVVGWILANRFSWVALGTSVAVGALTFLYLTRSGSGLHIAEEERRMWRGLAARGLVVGVAGYAIFLVTGNIYFTSAGIDNRVNIVAALGVAVLVIALLLRALEVIPPQRRESAFSLVLAVVAAVGAFVTTTIGTYWATAHERQQEVLAGLRQVLPAHPAGTTVIVDGVCPEIGPGVVFAAHYDLDGALKMEYEESRVKGVVATEAVRAGRRGVVITTFIFNSKEPMLYPYGARLLVYDHRRRTSERLTSRARARRYLETSPRLDCPPLRSFAWGIRTSRWVPFA
jgi:hypothetical protein